jgi:hypothetical protein
LREVLDYTRGLTPGLVLNVLLLLFERFGKRCHFHLFFFDIFHDRIYKRLRLALKELSDLHVIGIGIIRMGN